MPDENVVTLSREDERRIREEVAHLETMSPTSKSGEEMAYERDCLFLLDEVDRLRKWKDDLLEGCYVNCVYCGHRYAPGTGESQEEVLYDHISQCPKHPLSKALDRIASLEQHLHLERNT